MDDYFKFNLYWYTNISITLKGDVMKIYKTYFEKSDSPYCLDFQPRKKYHIVWKRRPYVKFLGHKVLKIKLFGIFTIYENKGD